MKNDDGWMKNDKGWMKNDKDEWWRMKNKGWKKNDEGWMMNDEGWWFQAVEGFCFLTDRHTDRQTDGWTNEQTLVNVELLLQLKNKLLETHSIELWR